jgi:hypothetical protein
MKFMCLSALVGCLVAGCGGGARGPGGASEEDAGGGEASDAPSARRGGSVLPDGAQAVDAAPSPTDARDGSALPDAPAAGATIEQACADLGLRLCARLVACEPFFVRLGFGAPGVCVDRMRLLCLATATTPGAPVAPARIVMCSRGTEAAACSDVINFAVLDACFPAGTRANGSTCGANGQCASNYCQKGTKSCGVCMPRVAASGKCDGSESGQCDRGLVCSMAGSCVAPATAGSVCNPQTRPCQAQLTCTGGVCVMPATMVGASCTDTDCSVLQGLYCAKPPGQLRGTCQPIGVAAPGERCGIVNNALVVCGGAGSCQQSGQDSKCVAPGGDGQGCGDDFEKRGCLAPAACIDKVCRLPMPAAC